MPSTEHHSNNFISFQFICNPILSAHINKMQQIVNDFMANPIKYNYFQLDLTALSFISVVFFHFKLSLHLSVTNRKAALLPSKLNDVACIAVESSKNWIDVQLNWVKIATFLFSYFHQLPFLLHFLSIKVTIFREPKLFESLISFSLCFYLHFFPFRSVCLWLCICHFCDSQTEWLFINFPSYSLFSRPHAHSLFVAIAVFHQHFNQHCSFLSTSRQCWCIVQLNLYSV